MFTYIIQQKLLYLFFGNNFQGKKNIGKLEGDETNTNNEYLIIKIYMNIIKQIFSK